MGCYQSFKQAFISQKLKFKVYRKNSSMQKYIVLIMYILKEEFSEVYEVVNCVWFIETLTRPSDRVRSKIRNCVIFSG